MEAKRRVVTKAGPISEADRADAALCATISVPFPAVIGRDELIGALHSAGSRDDERARIWAAHLERLLCEAPLPMVIAFMDRHGSPDMLRRAYAWHRARRGPPNAALERYLDSVASRSAQVD